MLHSFGNDKSEQWLDQIIFPKTLSLRAIEHYIKLLKLN